MHPLIAQSISGFGVTLKRLRREDLPLLCKWRNTDEVLHSMDDCRQVTVPVLEFWFKKVEASGHTFPFIGYQERTPVAYIDLRNCDAKRRICEDGIFLFGSHRFDQGLGSRIWLCRESVLQALGIRDVISSIRPENARSIHFFEKMGGTRTGMNGGFLVYRQECSARLAALRRVAARLGLTHEYENTYGEASL